MIATILALIARMDASLKRSVAKLRDARADHHALREMHYRDGAKLARAQADNLVSAADTLSPVRPKVQVSAPPKRALAVIAAPGAQPRTFAHGGNDA